MGAYIRTNGGVVPAKAAQFLPGPYAIRDVAIIVEALMTSTPVGTIRAPGQVRGELLSRAAPSTWSCAISTSIRWSFAARI